MVNRGHGWPTSLACANRVVRQDCHECGAYGKDGHHAKGLSFIAPHASSEMSPYRLPFFAVRHRGAAGAQCSAIGVPILTCGG